MFPPPQFFWKPGFTTIFQSQTTLGPNWKRSSPSIFNGVEELAKTWLKKYKGGGTYIKYVMGEIVVVVVNTAITKQIINIKTKDNMIFER
jgi:hypothetical protein